MSVILNRLLVAGLNLLLTLNVFYLVWVDKVTAVLVFLMSLLWLWRVSQIDLGRWGRAGLAVAQVLLYVLLPLVYLLSEVQGTTGQLIVAGLYLPVVLKIVPGIVEGVRWSEEEEGEEPPAGSPYTNLIYLYFAPVMLLQEPRIAYAVLAGYALVYVFGWEKYILRSIPVWERVVHVVGLSAVLLLVSLVLQ